MKSSFRYPAHTMMRSLISRGDVAVLGVGELMLVFFSRQKNVKGGVLIFVVADIWNCYNMDMFKLRYKQEYSADLSKNIIATAS